MAESFEDILEGMTPDQKWTSNYLMEEARKERRQKLTVKMVVRSLTTEQRNALYQKIGEILNGKED